MPSELLASFAPEDQDFERQIGCVTAIFQMFGRHHHKKVPSGRVLLNSSRLESEVNPYSSEILQEKNLAKYWYENEKASMESSRASCSSLSSLEFDKSSHKDVYSFGKTFFSERSLKNSSGIRNSEEVESGRRSSDFTVKTSSGGKANNHVYKHQDSPRPSFYTADNMPADLNEAIRVLIQLKKASLSFTDREAKDASFAQTLQKSSRFSCDQSREPPRLSLDSSKQCSRRSTSAIVSKTSFTLEDFDRANASPCRNRASNLLQDHLSSHKRHPGVVAKLMGIEDMPELNSPAHVAVVRRKMNAKNDQVSRSNRSRDPIVAKHMVNAIHAQKGNNQSLRSPKVRKWPTKAGDNFKSFETPIVILKPSIHSVMRLKRQSKTVNGVNASSHSIRGRLRLKQSEEQNNRENVVEIISERRISNCRADESSPASDRSSRSALHSTVLQQSIQIHKKSLLSVHQDASETELPSIAHEQLSPVLVQDDGPCTLNSLQDHGNLAQLKVLRDMQNPDNKYVSDILLAAGFLNKESATPLQQHIKPDLFSVLEKQHGHQKPSAEKNHRKLVFDVVSEILAHKNPCEFFLQRGRTLSGQQLLREICTEIQGLQARSRRWSTSSEDCAELISREDIIDRSEGWEDFCMEKIRVPLQIGRLIFQDLISEIVGEAALQTKQTKIFN